MSWYRYLLQIGMSPFSNYIFHRRCISCALCSHDVKWLINKEPLGPFAYMRNYIYTYISMYMMCKVITCYRRKSKIKIRYGEENFIYWWKLFLENQHNMSHEQLLKLINDLIINIQSLLKLANWEHIIFINANNEQMLTNFEDFWTLNSKCRVLSCSPFTSNIKTWFVNQTKWELF